MNLTTDSKQTIVVGTRIRWNDRCNHTNGVVFKIGPVSPPMFSLGTGRMVPIPQRPQIDCVWDNGTISYGVHPDDRDILPGIADAAEIATLLQAVETKKAADAKRAAEQAAADAAEQAALPGAHPHLIPCKAKPEWAKGRVAAENIRRELKRRWPSVKFAVRYRTFSGGDSIDVGWENGPTYKDVNAIADAYSAGDFDGMDDSYDYRHNNWIAVFGDAKYVHCQRNLSYAEVRRIWDEDKTTCRPEGFVLTEEGYNRGDLNHNDLYWFNQLLRDTDFTVAREVAAS